MTAFILVAAMLAAGPEAELRYRSSLGFSAIVPEGWLLLSQESIRAAGPDVLEKLGPGNSEMAESIRVEIQSGKLDVLMRAGAAGTAFVDNINIRSQPAKIELTRDIVTTICAQIMKSPDAVPPDVEGLEGCSFSEPNGHPALFLRKRGVGTTTLQYQILTPQKQVVAATAVFRSEEFDSVLTDLNRLVGSLEFGD